MSTKFRGIPSLRVLPKPTREAFEIVEEYLRRQSGPTSSTSAIITNTEAPPDPTGLGRVNFKTLGMAGLVQRLEPGPPDRLSIFKFVGTPTIDDVGNLRLNGPFTPFDGDDLLTVVSDGRDLFEVSRGVPSMERTFIPVRRFGVIPNTGADMTAKFQAVLDNPSLAGAILVFEPGTYIINGVTVTRDNTSIFLPPGCTLVANAATAHAVIYVAGTIDTVTAKNVVVNPDANDSVLPRGGERSVYVSPADAASGYFTVNSWISIEDEEDVPPPGRWNGGSDPDYALEHHMELARVFAINAGTGEIKLWFPIVNSYATIGIPPRLRNVTPVQGFRIWGGGKISNPITSGSGTRHGIQLFNVIEATIDEIVFEQVYHSCLALTRAQDTRIMNCEMRDAVYFDSKGYGVTMYGGIRVTVVGNTMRRLRHCVDVSFFSRQVTVTANVMHGSTTGNFETHPCVEGLVVSSNVIDGGHGEDGNIPALDFGNNPAAAVASGIDIDEACKDVSVIGNVIRNMRRAGIFVDMGHTGFPCEFVSIIGNTIENCCTARRLNKPSSLGFNGLAAIQIAEQSAGGNVRRGIVCKGNVLREPGQIGIYCDISNAIIEGNWIYHPADKTQASEVPAVGIGIWVAGGVSANCLNPIVRGNVIEAALQNGIRIGKDGAAFNVVGALVEGNITKNGTGAGIFLEETAPNTIVRGNWSEGNTGTNVDGINTQSDNGLFEGNTSVGNTGGGNRGIRLIGGADNNVLRWNVFSGPGLTNNTGGEVLDAGAGNFIVSHDLTNDRIGFGTATPQKTFELVGAQRLSFSTSANDFTDLTQLDRTGFYGGLAIEPAANSSALKWIHLFGQADTTAFSILDDGASYWIGRQKAGYDTFFGVASGRSFHFSINFADVLTIQPTGVDFNIPGSYRIADAATNTVVTDVTLYHTSSANTVAEFGVSLACTLDNGSSNQVNAGEIRCVWDTTTAGAEDSGYRFFLRDGGVFKEVMRLEGKTPQLVLHNNNFGAPEHILDMLGGVQHNIQARAADFKVSVSGAGNANALFVQDQAGAAVKVGIRKSTPADTLHVGGAIRSDATLRAGGTDAGIATFISYTNAIAAPIGGVAAALGNTGGAGEPATAAQSHWLKIMDGTTARWIAVWT